MFAAGLMLGLLGVSAQGFAQQASAAGAPTTTTAEQAPASPTAAGTAPAAAAKPAIPMAPAKSKRGKVEYTGPTTIILLAPTPMLDGEGKQRVDPDGKLMFNPPVQQLRDKKGHPVVTADGKPLFQTAGNLGYDEKGKRIVERRVKPPKMTPVSISAGTLTVDGWTGKARLNYDIADLKYLYIYAPGIGTTIVSQEAFPGAKEEPGGFNGTALKITVDGHLIELASEKPLLGKKPESAWVIVDRGFLLPARFPVFGYGTTTKAPYAWPGSKEMTVQAPPLPPDVRPTLLLGPCPAAMMRQAGPAVLPGQPVVQQPCVPIKPAATAASATAAPAAQ